MYKCIIWTIIAVNIFTFVLFGWDKFCARRGKWRVPEKILFFFAFFGGSLGALLGMKAFHHKTKHRKFTFLIPLFLVLHIALASWIIWLAKAN